MVSKEAIRERIAEIEDPELMVGVVDLGLIYDIVPDDNGHVHVAMTLTSPGCPYGPELISGIQQSVEEMEGVTKVTVELVWNPPWDPIEMATERGKDLLGLW